ncbi:MAG: FAD-linked oxidase C-terminal domain-containing protein [Thalassospira sp.]|uniref:FAD-linked oxidase C-terminal domain-containing protein n=1 Tax=Thalassospira sp. TaxID=1912094 RepID=UPI0032F097A8
MPEPDQNTLARRKDIITAMKEILPAAGGVIVDDDQLRPYECDGLMAYRQLPMIVVLPENTGQVASILKYCHTNKIRVVPRGAGTGLSGGALPMADAITISMMKFNRVIEIDWDNRAAVVQPGVTNLGITRAVEHEGFYYAPDPSSQIACSIGGNIAENSGGVHSLKYGLTTNNVLGVEMVTIEGEILRIGGKGLDQTGYDLLGIITGSEGLLGIVTEVTVRILRKPETARALLLGFNSSEEGGKCVAAIIAAGIIPGGLEMMDAPAIKATEDFVHAGYPLDVEALLLVELDGPQVEVDYLIERVGKIAKDFSAVYSRISETEEERLLFWSGRKNAFPAIGRISPDYMCMDGTIPRVRLAEVLAGMQELSKRHGLGVANVFHAGDGNLHPLIMFDANKAGDLEKAEEFGADILKLCVGVGGVLSGEHGIGVEKRDLMGEMFTSDDMKHQERIKIAFDEDQLLNPGKVFPTLHGCGELKTLHAKAVADKFPDIPRF